MPTSSPNLASVVSNPSIRKIVYTVFVVAVVAAGATQAAYASLGDGQPAWLTAALNVLAYLAVPVGGLALANTPSSKSSVSTVSVTVDPAPQDVADDLAVEAATGSVDTEDVASRLRQVDNY